MQYIEDLKSDYDYIPNHLKTGLFKLHTFLSGFQIFFDKMAAIYPDFKWLGLRVSDSTFSPSLLPLLSSRFSNCTQNDVTSQRRSWDIFLKKTKTILIDYSGFQISIVETFYFKTCTLSPWCETFLCAQKHFTLNKGVHQNMQKALYIPMFLLLFYSVNNLSTLSKSFHFHNWCRLRVPLPQCWNP